MCTERERKKVGGGGVVSEREVKAKEGRDQRDRERE